MKPYFESERGRLYCGDCLEVIWTLPDQSINCGITSPPYFGLRDYNESGQLGLESTPEEYVKKLVGVFREFRRILRDDGTLWLNLGDSYNSGRPGARDSKRWPKQSRNDHAAAKPVLNNLKHKDLVGIPWRVAFALQADGWYLRQDIIWHKPNAMPESVTDRCTKSHEYIFLLSKSARYYFDHEVIKEPCSSKTHARISKSETNRIQKARQDGSNTSVGSNRKSSKVHKIDGMVKQNSSFENACCLPVTDRNKRSVWTIPTKSFKGAHFATFPPDLILPCVLAGCPENGTIMDMFSGAGTTALVALENKRRFIGAELSREYCDMSIKRIEPIIDQMSY